MPAFPKSIDCSPFGDLHGEGQSKVWDGCLTVLAWGGDFAIRVHGTAQGPTPKQASTMSSLLSGAEGFRARSTPPILDYLLSSGVVPAEETLDVCNVWSRLIPWCIEVGPDAASKTSPSAIDAISITIGFEVPWAIGVVLQLEAQAGELASIFTES